MAAVQFTSTNGQSLSSGHVGGMNETLASPFAAQMFPWNKSTTVYSDLVPAVATNLALSEASVARRDGEAPNFGQIAAGYDIARIALNIDAIPRLGVNQGHGATPISLHVKGGTYYTNTMASVTAANAYAASIGKSLFDMGEAWFQGEQDYVNGRTKAQYQADLQLLAINYAADRKAISGQSDDPALFTYITDNKAVNDVTRSGVARAQHQASIDYFNGTIPSGRSVLAPVIISTPTYFMPRLFDGNGVHVGADWSYVLGHYVALAQFYCYMKSSSLPLNKRWPPMIPTAVDISGGVATITYQTRVAGASLAFGVASVPNGDGLPLQPNYGFGVTQSGSLVAINTPVIVGTNQVQITLASGVFGVGDRIGYAMDYPSANNFYNTQAQGNAGNLRDNYSLLGLPGSRCAAMNVPINNWVAPHDITLGSGASWTIS